MRYAIVLLLSSFMWWVSFRVLGVDMGAIPLWRALVGALCVYATVCVIQTA